MDMKYPPKNKPLTTAQVLDLCTQLGMHEEREAIEKDPPPKLFKWDGASMCPDQLGGINTDPASLPHDIRYWFGKKGDWKGRMRADCLFTIDLVMKCNCPARPAEIAFLAVRSAGNVVGTPFRWGFGR